MTPTIQAAREAVSRLARQGPFSDGDTTAELRVRRAGFVARVRIEAADGGAVTFEALGHDRLDALGALDDHVARFA
jgi:hypothetical protein